jgi:hypothetical protein
MRTSRVHRGSLAQQNAAAARLAASLLVTGKRVAYESRWRSIKWRKAASSAGFSIWSAQACSVFKAWSEGDWIRFCLGIGLDFTCTLTFIALRFNPLIFREFWQKSLILCISPVSSSRILLATAPECAAMVSMPSPTASTWESFESSGATADHICCNC